MKKQLPHLLLAVDLGASGTKIVASIVGQPDCQAVLMTPHCIKVDDKDSLASDPNFDENSIWVKIGEESYAVGKLAAIKHNATNKLKPAKFTIAVPKICAAIGVFAQKFSLPDKFDLSISFVLPPAEWEHKTIVIERLQIAMKDLETPRGKIKPKLLSISPSPEGMGILLGQDVDIKSVPMMTVIMLGFRNASVFTSSNGMVNRPQSSDLGFHDLLKEIAGKTGYNIADTIEPVFNYKQGMNDVEISTTKLLRLEQDLKAWAGLDFYDRDRHRLTQPDRDNVAKYQQQILQDKLAANQSLNPLLRCTGADRQIELDGLTKTIDKASNDYLTKLTDWLEEMMPSRSDKVCLSGGTANYFESELKDFVKDKVIDRVEGAVCLHSAIKLPDSFGAYNDRFNDIYSLWQQMERRSIPAAV